MKSKFKFSVHSITKIALLTACLCVSAFVTIQIGPVPITFQTLVINLIAILLTPTESFLAVLVYVLLGLVGLPVFSGASGGPAKLFGPTGGYILAFLISAPLMSYTKILFNRLTDKLMKNKKLSQIISYSVNSIIVGMVIVYLLGTVYMKYSLQMEWGSVLMVAVVPFIPLDVIKCVVAATIGVPIKSAIERM